MGECGDILIMNGSRYLNAEKVIFRAEKLVSGPI